MISLIAAVLAAANAVGLEIMSRRYTIGQIWWAIPPMSMFTTMMVYFLIHHSSGYLTSLLWFSLATLIFRILTAVFVLHESISTGNIIAAVALSIGTIAKIFVK